MTGKPIKTTCPYCARRVALTATGKLFAHKERVNGPKCARSGGRPN